MNGAPSTQATASQSHSQHTSVAAFTTVDSPPTNQFETTVDDAYKACSSANQSLTGAYAYT